jgi:hypothetical protein
MIGKVSIENLKTGEIPEEILKQLNVLNRISFSLKSTNVSAVSSQASDPTTLVPNTDPAFDLDRLVTSVKELEDLIEQLEDIADELTKDMAIPFFNDAVKKAVHQLDPNANAITKEVLEKALAIIDYFPMLMLGQDPALGPLIGDSTVEGPYLNCNEITKALGDIIKVPPKTKSDAEKIVSDKTAEIQEKWQKRMDLMFLEIILQLWWNILWPKFIVDMAIINPARTIVALPLDTIVVFFKKDCGGRFKKPKKDCVMGTSNANPPYSDAKGPINKILNKIRKFLLCKIPLALYPRYNPIVPIDCTGVESGDCPSDSEGSAKTKPRHINKDSHKKITPRKLTFLNISFFFMQNLLFFIINKSNVSISPNI